MAAPNGFSHFDPWYAALRSPIDPIREIPNLAFYYELQTADAAYETLPGSTLATAQNDGIGAVLDLKQYKERGAELVANGTFDAGTAAWTPQNVDFQVAGGEAVVTSLNETGKSIYQFLPTTAGKLYELTGKMRADAGNVIARSARVRISNGSEYKGVSVDSNGTEKEFTYKFIAQGAQIEVQCSPASTNEWGAIGDIAYFDDISIREIPGYHSEQDVATNQPVLNIENGIRSALFDGVDDRLVVPNSTGAVNFLHDGTGGMMHWCGRVTDLSAIRGLLSTWLGSNAVGAYMRVDADGTLRYVTTHGVLGESNGVSAVSAVAVGEICALSAGLAGTTLSLYKNGAQIATAEIQYPLSTADADGNFVIGALTAFGNMPFHGDMYAWGATGTLSDYTLQRLHTYMLRRAGA